MMGEIRRVKGNQIPHGTHIGVLVAAEAQCGKEGCDSWKTVGVDIDVVNTHGEATVRYIICLKHLGEFVEDMILSGGGIIEAGEDCGDPDCPVHGHLHDEDDNDA